MAKRLVDARRLGRDLFDGSRGAVDRAAVDEAIAWYERAAREDPASAARIAGPLDALRDLKAKLP